MRTFIACLLSPEAHAETLSVQDAWRERVGARVSWSKPDNLHITLKFLGEVQESQLPEIQALLGAIAHDSSAFPATLSTAHAFPSPRHPRVLVVDVQAPPLEALALRVEEALDPQGFPTEKRPFHGHVTVGRVREGHLVEGVLPPVQPISWQIAEMVLFASKLSPEGSLYEVLARFPLSKPSGD